MRTDHEHDHGLDDEPERTRCDSRQRTVASVALAAGVLLGVGLLAAALLAPPSAPSAEPQAAVPAPPPPPPPPPPVLHDRDRERGTGGLGGGTGRARAGDGTGAGPAGQRTGSVGTESDDAPAGSSDTAPGPTPGGTGEAGKPAEVPGFGFTVDKPEEPPAAPAGVPEANDGAGKAGKGTEFLGLTTKARTVVFVLDYSASMRGEDTEDEDLKRQDPAEWLRRQERDKTKRLRQAMTECLTTMQPGTRFSIVLFGGCVLGREEVAPARGRNGKSDGSEDPTKRKPIDEGSAEECTVCLDGKAEDDGAVKLDGNQQAARSWLKARDPHPQGESRPAKAMRRALLAKPQAVYLLTDGEFNPDATDALLATVAELNADKATEIHTIAFGSEGDISVLRQLAEENKGQYTHVTLGSP